MAECLHIAAVFERADEFDVIHNGFDFLPLTYSGLVDTPVVTTDPRLLVRADRAGVRALRRDHRLRRDQRRRPAPAPALRGDDPPRHRHRRVRRAPVARRAPAVLRPHPPRQGHRTTRSRSRAAPAAASTSPASSRTRRTSASRSNRTSTASACATSARSAAAERAEVLGGAHALLHLIDFDEPFGYSVAESLACGTPVIAFARGSMPELIEHGETGFLVARRRRSRRRGRPMRRARSSRDPRVSRRTSSPSPAWSPSTSPSTATSSPASH